MWHKWAHIDRATLATLRLMHFLEWSHALCRHCRKSLCPVCLPCCSCMCDVCWTGFYSLMCEVLHPDYLTLLEAFQVDFLIPLIISVLYQFYHWHRLYSCTKLGLQYVNRIERKYWKELDCPFFMSVFFKYLLQIQVEKLIPVYRFSSFLSPSRHLYQKKDKRNFKQIWNCIDFMDSMSCSQVGNISVDFHIYSKSTNYYVAFWDAGSEIFKMRATIFTCKIGGTRANDLS